MPPQKLNIQPLLDKAKAAREEYRRTGSMAALFRMVALYGEVNNILMGELKQQAQQPQSPMDPLINTAGRGADRAAANLTDLRRQLDQAGDNPPPALLAKIQIATQAYQAWMTALKSAADAKGETQKSLARF